MIIVKTLFYLIKLMVRKTKIKAKAAPSFRGILMGIGVLSLIGFICLLIGRRTAK